MRNSIIVYVDKSNQNQYTALIDSAVYEVDYNEFNDVVTVCGFVCPLSDLDWKKLQECCQRVDFNDLPEAVKKQIIRLLEA